MAGFTLHTSNRLEILADGLVETLTRPSSSPFLKKTVLVQSKGMERWISMQVARSLGICANIEFPFPNAFIHRIFSLFADTEAIPWTAEPGVLAWRIMELLPGCIGKPGFEIVGQYLQRDNSQLRRFQLARHISALFDQYLVFRPDMILVWEAGHEDHWQARLWRELTGGQTVLHGALLKDTFHRRCRDPRFRMELSQVPEHFAVFGISSLPAFHMEVIGELARFVDIDFFLLNPCREYWADIRSEKEMGRIARKSADRVASIDDLHMEEGNTLLASLGAMGRDFFDLVHSFAPEVREVFRNPGEDTLLHALQSDVLELADRGPADRLQVAAGDRSVAVHSCHSPMREIEVLHDHMLAMLEEDPSLRPRDILVMTPDIHLYAPVIQAVFETPENPESRIPYTIADKTLRRQSRIIEAFLSLLELPGSRFTAGQVLSVLDHDPVRRRFELSQADLDLIRQWIQDTRIRWGVDSDHRAQLGMKPTRENTWLAGMERLLLGYAMTGGGETLFQDILPYDLMEGSDTPILGRFIEFVDRLFRDTRRISHPMPLSEWGKTLGELLDHYIEPEPATERELLGIHKTLRGLAAIEEQSGNHEVVTFEVIHSILKDRFESEGYGSGFLSGGVTFCAMLPMRSIPFRVIWLLGMNDDAFPRHERILGFDLMQKSPRKGDRSQRNDDRYLFLEAILSARDRFIISYVGQSLRDNSAIPPSVVVSELLDVIAKGFEHPEGGIMEAIVTHHPLQPFSPRQFTGPEDTCCFSYSRENCQAAAVLRGVRTRPEPKFPSALPEPEAQWRDVTVAQLARFFSNPSKYFLERRLKVDLTRSDAAPEDVEPFTVGGLDRYRLGASLLERRSEGRETAALLPALRAAGELPHGTVGTCVFDLLARKIDDFYTQIAPYLSAEPLPPLDMELDFAPFRLTGRIDRITSGGLVHYRHASVRAKDRLQLWIRHLMIGLSPELTPMHGLLLGTDCGLEFAPVPNGREWLGALLDLYWQGLTAPLPFFPQSSLAFARAVLQQSKSEVDGLKAARDEWTPNTAQDAPREGEDPHMELCFRNSDPLGPLFREIALTVFEPLLAHERKIG